MRRLKGKVVSIKDEWTGEAAKREEAAAREENARREAEYEQSKLLQQAADRRAQEAAAREAENARRRLAEQEAERRAREAAAAREAERQEALRRQEEERRIYEEQRRLYEHNLLLSRQRELERREQENRRLAKERETSAATLHRLRELIRLRYQLDIEIWSLRNVEPADRPHVIQRGKMADAVLKDIYSIVDAWNDTSWDAREAKVAKIIKDYLSREGPRRWEGNPPWKDLEDEESYSDDDFLED